MCVQANRCENHCSPTRGRPDRRCALVVSEFDQRLGPPLSKTLQAKAETALDATLLRELTPLANSVITLAKDAPYGVAIANAKKSHTQNIGAMLSAEEIRVRDAIRAKLADADADDVIARLRKAKTNSALTA